MGLRRAGLNAKVSVVFVCQTDTVTLLVKLSPGGQTKRRSGPRVGVDDVKCLLLQGVSTLWMVDRIKPTLSDVRDFFVNFRNWMEDPTYMMCRGPTV